MILFSFPEQTELAKNLTYEQGVWQWRYFPDRESYVRIISNVKGKEAIILCSLNQPDVKIMPFLFLAKNLRDLGAKKITLIAPYLGYMRQDKRFNAGEAITSEIFAGVLSPYIDALITIDPHLHRRHDLKEIYQCDTTTISAAPLMAKWIKENVAKALIIGPDMESEQWVKMVAESAGAPYLILEKIRHGDKDVEIILDDIVHYKDYVPVLVDDMISTAATMIKTIELLRQQHFNEIICLATHGLFAGDAYRKLQNAGVKIITANTVAHISNGLDVAPMIKEMMDSQK